MKITQITLHGSTLYYLNEETGESFQQESDLPEGAILEEKDLDFMNTYDGEHPLEETEPYEGEEQSMEDPCPPDSDEWKSMMEGMKDLSGPLD